MAVDQNDLGITRLEIQRSGDADSSVVELRGLGANDEQLAYLSLHTGMVQFAYEVSDPTELTRGREISVGLTASDLVETVIPGSTTQEVVVPPTLATFVGLEAVRNEATLVGINFAVDGTSQTYKQQNIARIRGASCQDFPGVWGTTSANAMPAGSTCALDVLVQVSHHPHERTTVPFQSFQCVIGSGGSLVSSLFSTASCTNDQAGTNHACGTGAGSPGQCVYGPCSKGGSTLVSLHTAPAGNPNCSAGFKHDGANWNFTLNGFEFCSANGCSSGNGLNPAAGCSFTSCCYDATTHKGCAVVGACPATPSCP